MEGYTDPGLVWRGTLIQVWCGGVPVLQWSRIPGLSPPDGGRYAECGLA